MTAIIALFPGEKDATILRTRDVSVCACAHCLPTLSVTSPGLWRLDWPEDEDAAPSATKLADLPSIPEIPC